MSLTSKEMPPKQSHKTSSFGGQLFKSRDEEIDGFSRLKQLLYIAKNCSRDQDASSFAKTLNFLRRMGFPLLNVCKKDSSSMRCDAFRSKFNSAQRLFFSSFASTSSVTNSIFVKNKSCDPTDLFPPKQGHGQESSRDKKFPNIRSRTIKELASIDFASYLIFEADNKTKITSHTLFQQVNSRLPFFKTLEGFMTAFDDLSNLSYLSRAEVFYVLAEYYLRLKQRSHALYQVELDSYGSLLLESRNSSDHKYKEAHRKIKYNLNRGDRTRQIATGSDEAFVTAADPLTSFIDSSRGLPLSAMRGGAMWSNDSNGPNIPLKTSLQMTEILLNEPLFSDKDIIDTSVDLNQTLEIDGFDPLLLGSMETLSTVRPKHYVEDVHKKWHIALREVRKNVLLHNYTLKVDKFVSSKDAAKFDAEHIPVESKVSEILTRIFKPVVAEVDQNVLPHLSEAHNFIFAESKSKNNLSELDTLLSRPDYSLSTPLSHTSPSSYLSHGKTNSIGNMPVL